MDFPKQTAVATLLILAQYGTFALMVGGARRRFGVKVPTMTGPPRFERTMRVHLNTMEQLPIVLPLVWMAALTAGDALAAWTGVAWVGSRVVFAIGYLQDARRRTPGALLGDAVLAALIAEVAWGLTRVW